MKYFLLALVLTSCSVSKKMDKYLGQSKADIMMVYGINPVKDGWVDGLGRVLAYSQFKNIALNGNQNPYYKHTVFILNQDLKCIAWSVRNEAAPFDQLNVRIFRQ